MSKPKESPNPQPPLPEAQSLATLSGSLARPGEKKEKQTDQEKPRNKALDKALKSLDKQEKAGLKQIEEIFESRISGARLPEMAITAIKELKEEQKKEYQATIEKYKNIFKGRFDQKESVFKDARNELSSEIFKKSPTPSTVDSEQSMQELYDNATIEINSQIEMLKALMEVKSKTGYMTIEDIVKLKASLKNLKQIVAANRENKTISEEQKSHVEILKKLSNHQALTDLEYQKISQLITPYETLKMLDPTTVDKKIDTGKYTDQKTLDATMAGLMISMMRPDQRYKLIEEFVMRSEKKAQTGPIIDSFLSTGILTIAQGKALFDTAFSEGLIIKADYDRYLQKCNGQYQKEKETMENTIKNQSKKLTGMYATNPIVRGFGGPAVGFFMGVHSLIWIFSNVLANQGDIKALLKNPYLYGGVAEYILSKEISSGGMKYGTPNLGIGYGSVSKWIEDNMSFNDGAKKEKVRKSFKNLSNMYSNYPNFGLYLEKGGCGTIMDLYKAKQEKNKKQALKDKKDIPQTTLSIDELLIHEENENNKDILRAAIGDFGKETITNHLNALPQIAVDLKINTRDRVTAQKDFEEKLTMVRQDQGINQVASF